MSNYSTMSLVTHVQCTEMLNGIINVTADQSQW